MTRRMCPYCAESLSALSRRSDGVPASGSGLRPAGNGAVPPAGRVRARHGLARNWQRGEPPSWPPRETRVRFALAQCSNHAKSAAAASTVLVVA